MLVLRQDLISSCHEFNITMIIITTFIVISIKHRIDFCYNMCVKHTQLNITMLSQATSVPGQGVGSAFLEQVNLVKQSKKLQILINSFKKTDILHIHTLNPQYIIRAHLTRKPVIIYVHLLPSTLNDSITLPPIFMKFMKWYVKKAYQSADFLVVVNPSFIQPLMDLGIKKDKITFIPNYVDSKDFSFEKPIDELKQKYHINRFTVLGVGQVQHRKGVLDFIDVARRLPQFDFIWAGGFSFKSMTAGYGELKKIMDKPPKNVRFLGIVPREQMKEIYAICDVFFLPSYEELMPMSVLEAATMQKPILLRSLELYQPVFFNHHLQATNNEEFAKMIIKLSSEEALYQEALQHSSWLTTHYNKASILKQWENYYQEVIDRYGKTY